MTRAPGVIRVGGDNRRAIPVPAPEVAATKRIVTTGLAVLPCQFLQAGERVRVLVGPLQGMEGIVVARKGERRLVVSMAMLQRSVAVEVEGSWLAPKRRRLPVLQCTAG